MIPKYLNLQIEVDVTRTCPIPAGTWMHIFTRKERRCLCMLHLWIPQWGCGPSLVGGHRSRLNLGPSCFQAVGCEHVLETRTGASTSWVAKRWMRYLLLRRCLKSFGQDTNELTPWFPQLNLEEPSRCLCTETREEGWSRDQSWWYQTSRLYDLLVKTLRIIAGSSALISTTF